MQPWHGAVTEVQDAARHGEHLGVVVVSPHKCAQPGEQLGQLERFGEIVLRAGVQPVDPVLGGTARRQHEHRGGDTLRAQPRDQSQPFDRRQPSVDHHHVERSGQRQVQTTLTVGSGGDVVAFGGSARSSSVARSIVVLDEQQ